MKVLHQIPDSVYNAVGEVIKEKDLLAYHRQKTVAILQSYGSTGNCVPAKDTVNCYSGIDTWPKPNIDCDATYVFRREEMSPNRLGQWDGTNFYDCYGNGLDFMLLCNLYRLVYD